MYISKILLLTLISMISFSLISGHGYSIYPMARQTLCPKGNIWWPDNGDGITDDACRAAFKYVQNKGNNPQFQFVQINEYSINIPTYAQGDSALQAAVPSALCSAYATSSSNDKSGMSIAAPWTVTTIPVSAGATNVNITYTFCATATHEPSYWEFYVSNPGFNPATTELKWSDLTKFKTFGNTANIPFSHPSCTASKGYAFNISLPTRFSNSVLLVRWQRDDPVGETFINCSDFKCVV